jgi:hypothetical protein
VAGALKYLRRHDREGLRAVVLLPDSATRYMSKVFNDAWMREGGYMEPENTMGTVGDLLKRARAAGLSATSVYDPTFAGRFVTVNQKGKQVLGAFATKSAIDTIAVPYVPVCE